MQDEFVGQAMIGDERGQSNSNDGGVPSLDTRRLLESEESNQDASYSHMHRHLVRF